MVNIMRLSSTRRDLWGFTSVLASAILEWILIFLLFVNALFSYLVTKFATFFELQTPCLFCSRLDHVFGGEKKGFYWNLICEIHCLEISSLAYCLTHKKLFEIHGMCEDCFLASGIGKTLGFEGYKLQSYTSGKEPQILDYNGHEDGSSLLQNIHNGHTDVDSTSLTQGARFCSCCKSPFVVDVCGSLLTNHLLDKDSLMDLKVRSQSQSRNVVKRCREKSRTITDPLPHIAYTELKITSDTELEVLVSDNEGSSHISVAKDQCIMTEVGAVGDNLLPKYESDDLAYEKQHNQAIFPMSPTCTSYITSLASDVHDLERFNSHQVEEVHNSSNVPHLISSNISPSTTSSTDALVDAFEEKLNVKESKDMTLVPATNSSDISRRTISDSDQLSTRTTSIEPTLSIPSFIDINEAYRLAISSKTGHASTSLVETPTAKDSIKLHEDLKLLLSQMSASRGLEFPLNDMSPRIQVLQGEDSKVFESSNSMVSKRFSIDRNESGFESLDGSIVSDIDGESVVDRLRRQIEFDRRSMNALFKELEEERNASAIAANQAMAMINRLQEEKAGMQMEALHYQRMMEEQAAYDQEAIQKLTELLSQKGKELQDLETALESYRTRFPDESGLQKAFEEIASCERTHRNTEVKNYNICFNSNVDKSESGNQENICRENADDLNNLLDRNTEIMYISECLKKLERMLVVFSGGGINNISKYGSKGNDLLASKQTPNTFHSLDTKKEQIMPEYDGLSKEGSDDDNLQNQKSKELVVIKNEIAHLTERLDTLQSDRKFLELALDSLKKGNEGTQFIQEIACHLRNLRQIQVKSREVII